MSRPFLAILQLLWLSSWSLRVSSCSCSSLQSTSSFPHRTCDASPLFSFSDWGSFRSKARSSYCFLRWVFWSNSLVLLSIDRSLPCYVKQGLVTILRAIFLFIVICSIATWCIRSFHRFPSYALPNIAGDLSILIAVLRFSVWVVSENTVIHWHILWLFLIGVFWVMIINDLWNLILWSWRCRPIFRGCSVSLEAQWSSLHTFSSHFRSFPCKCCSKLLSVWLVHRCAAFRSKLASIGFPPLVVDSLYRFCSSWSQRALSIDSSYWVKQTPMSSQLVPSLRSQATTDVPSSVSTAANQTSVSKQHRSLSPCLPTFPATWFLPAFQHCSSIWPYPFG